MSNWVVGRLGNKAVDLDSGMMLDIGGGGETDQSESWSVIARSMHGQRFCTIQEHVSLAEARAFIEQCAKINSVYYTDADAWLKVRRMVQTP